jgi:hypothetical protein
MTMSSAPSQPVRAEILRADVAALNNIEALSDYQPNNANFTREQLAAIKAELDRAETERIRAKGACQAAVDNYRAATWAFHAAILGAKDQVRAQYGDDSNEVQAVGLKKKSERKAPGRKRGAKPIEPPTTT